MGTGNTEGRIVGQPSVPEKKAQEANPAVSAETEEEKGFLNSLFDIPLNSGVRGRWLAISALYHGQYESYRSIAEGFGDEALAGFDSTYDNPDVQFASVIIDVSGAISSGGTGKVRRARNASSAEKGRFRGVRSPAQAPVLAGAGGMPYGEGLDILNAERRAAGSSVKNADTTAESPILKTERAKDGGRVKNSLTKKVPCFHPFDKEKFKRLTTAEQKKFLQEYARQLRGQQDAINSMTAAEYKSARDAFKAHGRDAGSGDAQRVARARVENDIKKNIASNIKRENPSLSREEVDAEASRKAADAVNKLAALHEPDMVAGGAGGRANLTNLGARGINSSIGASWNQDGRLTALDDASKQLINAGDGSGKMNIKLELCRGKGLK
ncbi:polymorphic toxin type 15 domain-containing protein [Salmonella bongori]|nr:polymorphic toxin type 15 domain-containing protein [Salmonella bongori]AID27485.1 hypothetical protein N643_13510 [Salmonella bongori serovar 48:z41:-- str. RKS3044]